MCIQAQFRATQLSSLFYNDWYLSVIAHWRKNQDYLVIRLYQDLVGDWVVAQSRYQLHAALKAADSYIVLHSYQEARQLVLDISKQLRCAGYKKTIANEEQLGFNFD